MKKYVIRSIGWVFDDDWYNFDGEHDIEGIYESEEEAYEKCIKLNSIFFLYHFERLGSYQVNLPGPNLKNVEFVNISWIADYIAEELSFNREEIWGTRTGRLKGNQQVLSHLNQKQIEVILKHTGLSFFKIYEFNSEEPFLFEFKRNEMIWDVLYDENEDGPPEHFYYFHDDRDHDQKRAVTSIIECYEFALFSPFSSFEHDLTSRITVKGSLQELSRTPNLLKTVLSTCKQIIYHEEERRLVFKSPSAPEELMRLDAVLIQPILIWEKISIDHIQKVSSSYIELVQQQVENDFGSKSFMKSA